MLSLTVTVSTRFDNALYLLRNAEIARDKAMANKDPAKLLEAAENSIKATLAAGKAFSSYTFAFFFGAVVEGGDGANYIETWDFAAVAGQGGDDEIHAQNYALVSGGSGDDTIGADHFAFITGGAGNDTIDAYDFATIDGGSGDDDVYTYSYANVSGGTGNDKIEVGGDSTVDGGAGDDFVVGGNFLIADGGDGDDYIRAGGGSHVSGGDGDDTLDVSPGSFVEGGRGDDVLFAAAPSGYTGKPTTLDGGQGNDYLHSDGDARLIGGTGDDIIEVMSAGANVLYARGDGSDTIRAISDLTLSISGYLSKDVTLTTKDDKFIVSFAGSDETLTFDLTSGVTASLRFDDGGTLDLTGADVRKDLSKWSTHS